MDRNFFFFLKVKYVRDQTCMEQLIYIDGNSYTILCVAVANKSSKLMGLGGTFVFHSPNPIYYSGYDNEIFH